MEIKLMEHLLSIYGINQSHQIVSYNTSIYDLYAHMFVDTDPDDVDLLQLLKEREPDPVKKKLFDDRYSDILLVFDLDPQDSRFSVEKITRMVSYFIESSDMGKLYLNYPMVEAFYHMNSIPDPAYFSYVASLEELQAHKYKERVVAENSNHRFSKFAVDRNECNTVIEQNIEKAWWMLNYAGKGDTEQLLPEAAAVSYTHLDVYKRQAVYCPDRRRPAPRYHFASPQRHRHAEPVFPVLCRKPADCAL